MKAYVLTLFLILGAIFLLQPQYGMGQTNATLGENAVGLSNCPVLSDAADFDTVAQCNASSGSGFLQKSPVVFGQVTSPPYANTNCDANKAGMIRWTGSALQGCNGSSWVSFSGPSSCTSPSSITAPSNATNQTASSLTTSGTFTVTGAGSCAQPIVCNGCANIILNGVASGISSVYRNTDTVALQSTNASTGNATVSATITIGTATSGAWTTTTAANSVAAFSFTNQTNVAPGAKITSNNVTLSGGFTNQTATCVSCTISKNNSSGTFTASVSNINSGDYITLRQVASSSNKTATPATVTIGSTVSTWTVTTAADPCNTTGYIPLGQRCTDNSFYVGRSPDGNKNMFLYPCRSTQYLTVGWSGVGIGCDAGTDSASIWFPSSFATGVTNKNTGYNNSNNIGGSGYGAVYCRSTISDNSTYNFGRSDWYLPSIEELKVVYWYVQQVGTGSNLIQSSSYYWSSTEVGSTTASRLLFSTGVTSSGTKSGLNGIARCVRKQ